MDRLSAVKAMQQEEAAKKAAAENANAEKEAKRGELSAERKKVAAEVASTESVAGEAENALQEVSAMEAQGELNEDIKTELATIKAEAQMTKDAFIKLKNRLAEIDTEIAALEGDESAATSQRAPEPTVEVLATKVKPAEISPEDSQKNLEQLRWNTISTTRDFSGLEGFLDESKIGYSVASLMKANAETTARVQGLQTQLEGYAVKDPSKLSAAEKTQLSSLLASAYGQYYYDVSWGRKPYDETGKTGMHVENEQIDYFSQHMDSVLKEIRAEVLVLEGKDSPARVGRVDLQKMKAGLEGVRPEDQQAWLEALKQEITRSESVLKNAAALKAKHIEELQKSEPALRASERTRHNAILHLDEVEKKVREKFASVL